MSLVKDLQQAIDYWLNSKKNHSLPLLAKLSGVSYPTVRRMQQALGEPTLNNVLSIIKVIMSSASAQNFLKKNYSDYWTMINASLPDQAASVAEEEEEVTRIHTHEFLILGLASMKNGVHRDKIAEKTGEIGLEALDNLIQAGLVEEFKDRIICYPEKVRTTLERRSLQSMPILCELFESKRHSSEKSLLHIATAGVNNKTIKEILKILSDATGQIQSLLSDPSRAGDHVLGFGIVSTSLHSPEPR